MRIAISGSAGTGKTTLAQALASRLGVPFIDEEMRRLIESGLDLHDLGPGEHRALLERMTDTLYRRMREAEASAGGFVSDRGPLDMAAFWLYYRFGFDVAATARFMARSAETARWLDATVVLPHGAIPLEDDGVRSANPWIQLHFQALLEGLGRRRASAGRVWHVPSRCRTPSARVAWVAWVAGRLDARGGAARDDPRAGSRGDAQPDPRADPADPADPGADAPAGHRAASASKASSVPGGGGCR